MEIVVYWRPGCMFCSSLLRKLDNSAVPYQSINIWDDVDAAATVRAIADGNETVPTVVVGPVSLVNPSFDEVLVAASEHSPDAVPADWEPKQPGKLARWITDKLGG